MNTLTEFRPRLISYILVILTFVCYAVIFARYHDQLGIGIASLATIPVIVGGWYFGIAGGITVAASSIVISAYFQTLPGHSALILLSDPGTILRITSLILIAIVTGKLSEITHARREAILKLEQYENERESHTHFLELLNKITAKSLEADSLKSTLEVLLEEIARLFKADDAFFTLWDQSISTPVPTSAFGRMKDIYPFVRFEPGEVTLSTSVMQAEHSIAVVDIENSPYMSPRVAAIFPSCSMLGIPLITQQKKLGAILLGYNKKRAFDDSVIRHAEIIAEQVALVLFKSQVLEEERKQFRQLTALHDVALTSIEVDDEDELIVRVTDIIGQNLFLDNFGIMLMDEEKTILRAHASYRFHSVENPEMREVRVGEGITGIVAETGQPQRIGDVRRNQEYIDIDDRTLSELCVPIKFKERILGVINAESTKRDAFSTDDERLLVTLAGQLAIALEQLRKAQDERKWLGQLAHSNALIYSIAQITSQIEKSLSAHEIVESLGSELERIGLTCIMAVYDKDRKQFTINYTSLSPQFLDVVETGLGYPLVDYVFPHHKLNAILKTEDLSRPSVIADSAEEIKALFIHINEAGIPALLQRIGVTDGVQPLRLPLVYEENLLGVLWVWGKDITRSDLPIMSIFAKQIGTSLERARLFQEVQSLAFTDPLTGLQNRRSLFELGRIEFARAQRMDRPFCCMMLDLDHFKQVNDTYGHPIGDQVLHEFAQRTAMSVREIDLVGRYGGEELIILLPETDRETALMVAERLRASVAATPIKLPEGEVSITVSIGVATMNEYTMQLETLIARADQAVYIAKHKGRNCVAISV